ncbi:hypothetical protein Kpol_489p10 [Vanderwaltozyma polyspora DSM 70294]|uniref:PNPLA domain-containing protein n=1 Tax=Vanderwaltozyma polyspora (strain ATCC 22028 / DSM 70294 / BCRC 21397 / CBS 2163 / NBRC 10782 / NRRL Y-8283 / UCD 57-17) TaxID=436907 RepID=A7TQ24_VANPO|nr:uncharacterized protein Kpol_489p10 [Vanderwaltozyma polyspora DSM 70294]EDO15629.1 hypothetical protein Kpol_489p10 [Vanderwaltozyma polyspora DSM 70294]
MAVDIQNYHVTQHLIEKYYEHILGSAYKEHISSRGSDYSNSSSSLKNNTKAGARETSIDTKQSKSNSDSNEVSSQSGSTKVGGDKSKSLDDTSSDTALNNDQENDSKNASEEKDNGSFIPKCKNFLHSLFAGDYERDLLIERVLSEKQHAMSFEEWKAAGLRLDGLTNKNQWKQRADSNLYDYKLIKGLTEKLRQSRLDEDYYQLLYLIRTNWVRNLGGMGNVNLYRRSHVGTKYIIDDYIEESRLCIEVLLNQSELDDSYLLGILQQTRRNIGRTALVLSGGGTFGLFHIGVLATLFELDLLPRVISGSSAGAIIASILSVHHKDEIPELLERVLESEFNIFKDDSQKSDSENLLIKISRSFKSGTWFDNQHLVNTMIMFLGDLTFREAYNRTGKILNITVSPASLFEQPRLLNNLTAPNVLIWSAVCASCSLPGIFPSTNLYEKDPRTGETREWNGSSSVKFVDGSVDNDLPISRLSEMFNVDHIIACQVNPHVFPFLKFALSCVGGDIEDEFSARFKQNISSIYSFLSNELIHMLEMGSELGIAKNVLTKFRSVLSQQYSGDITILPDMKMLLRMNEILINPSTEFLLRETTNGARATWPKVCIIQNHCGQELELDKAITYLKGKIIVSASIKNPLQFAEMPVGLIKSSQQRVEDNTDDNPISNVLDDNLLEAESSNSLLLLRENASHYKRASNSKVMFSTYALSNNTRRNRRSTDLSTNTRNMSHSFSFSASSPSSRVSRYPHRHSVVRPSIYKKGSTGQLLVPKDPNPVMVQSRKLFDDSDSSSLTGEGNHIVVPSPSLAKISTLHSIEFGVVKDSYEKTNITATKFKYVETTDELDSVFVSESDNDDISPKKVNNRELRARKNAGRTNRRVSSEKNRRRTSLTPVKKIMAEAD